MSEYGKGIYSHGELIETAEQDRLFGKRAFLRLLDHLLRNDEALKASQLVFNCTPWHLDEDVDVIRFRKVIGEALRPLFYVRNGDSAQIKEQIIRKEMSQGPEAMDYAFKVSKLVPRIRWIMDRVISENPTTVLDVGAGWGEIPVEIAKLGIHVTALAPFEAGTRMAKEIQEEKGLPIQWVHEIFETCEFGETKFDVVLLGEIIEHVIDDVRFIQRACDLANRAVLITTPAGSFDRGLRPPTFTEHVRAYSTRAIKSALDQLKGVTYILECLPVEMGTSELHKQYHLVKILKNKKEVKHVDTEDEPSDTSTENERVDVEGTKAESAPLST
jgi:2-polyprenyl-3-methyl-5-hydroxy-6-metoxy-1,4-benzoquinol methylase